MRIGLVEELGSGSLGAVCVAASIAATSDVTVWELDGLSTGGASRLGGRDDACTRPGMTACLRGGGGCRTLFQKARLGAGGTLGACGSAVSGCRITGAFSDACRVTGSSICRPGEAGRGCAPPAAAWLWAGAGCAGAWLSAFA